jgi:8-oxo-dGTP pyrophosphatase MutT (NUDIX family)
VVEGGGVPAPVAAATVLLLKDEPEGGFSVFMVQRSLQSSFMPGAYVFPGGKVEPEDFAQPVDLSESELAKRFSGDLGPASARAHLVAAQREVAEEAKVELGDPTGMQAFSHWITPAVESRRFDTWFLVAEMPPDARPTHDDHEVVASRWVEPRSAIARYGDGDIMLAPPTYYTLWDLARFESAAEVIADAASRKVVGVQPRFQEVDGRMTLLLPGDPLYLSEHSVAGPTRIVLGEGGRWWLVDPMLSDSEAGSLGTGP